MEMDYLFIYLLDHGDDKDYSIERIDMRYSIPHLIN